MKELKHDIESYIITIKRKGQQTAAAQTLTSSVTIPVQTTAASTPAPAALPEPQAVPQAAKQAEGGTAVTAPLPGIIIGIRVKPGDTVTEGQELAVLEAMKMENSIESPVSGTVLSLSVSPGDTVSEGTLILTIKQ